MELRSCLSEKHRVWEKIDVGMGMKKSWRKDDLNYRLKKVEKSLVEVELED